MVKLKLTRDVARKIVDAGTPTTRDGRQKIKKGVVGRLIGKLRKSFVNVLQPTLTLTKSQTALSIVEDPENEPYDYVLLRGQPSLEFNDESLPESEYGPTVVTNVVVYVDRLEITKKRIRLTTPGVVYLKKGEVLTNVSTGNILVLGNVD